jgi:hypothetical protein
MRHRGGKDGFNFEEVRLFSQIAANLMDPTADDLWNP